MAVIGNNRAPRFLMIAGNRIDARDAFHNMWGMPVESGRMLRVIETKSDLLRYTPVREGEVIWVGPFARHMDTYDRIAARAIERGFTLKHYTKHPTYVARPFQSKQRPPMDRVPGVNIGTGGTG